MRKIASTYGVTYIDGEPVEETTFLGTQTIIVNKIVKDLKEGILSNHTYSKHQTSSDIASLYQKRMEVYEELLKQIQEDSRYFKQDYENVKREQERERACFQKTMKR